jgi:hypothetical protein
MVVEAQIEVCAPELAYGALPLSGIGSYEWLRAG